MQYFYKMADGREHGPKFNISFFNLMFEGLTEAGRIDDALKVYRRMPDKEIKPNTTTFDILVKALCKEGNLDRARDLVVDMARGSVVPPSEFREHVVDIFKNADRQDEIEKAFEEKALPAPQPRVEYRPPKPPQGLPGFSPNQTLSSRTPQQGRPWQPEGMPPKPQQPVFGSRNQVGETDVAGRSLQHGYGAPQVPQPGFRAPVGQAGQPPEYGGSHPWQHASGATQVQQPSFSSAPTGQPGFGYSQSQQPTFSAHQNQQPMFGSPRSWQSGFSAPQVQQPGYGAPRSSQIVGGSPQPPQPQFGTSHGVPGYGQMGNQHDRFGPHQNEPKFNNHSPQSGNGLPQSGHHTFQGQSNFEPHHGHAGFVNRAAGPAYGASQSQPSHGTHWSQSGYESLQGQWGHVGPQGPPHPSNLPCNQTSFGVPHGQNNNESASRSDGAYGQPRNDNSYHQSCFGADKNQPQRGGSDGYKAAYIPSYGQGFSAPHSETETAASESEGLPESTTPEDQQQVAL
jgi:pentatricopeptide repeat protein